MGKDPTPKADGLRAMREASRGHLQATANEIKPKGLGEKKVVFVGPNTGTGALPIEPAKPARKRKKLKRKTS